MTKTRTEVYEVEVPESLEEFKSWEFSSGVTTGKDFDEFSKLYKRFVKKNLPERAELVEFNKGHYILSGFIEGNGDYVYFSVSDVRYFKNEWADNILVRTAENEKDFTGGINVYSDLEHFRERVGERLKKG